MKAVLISTVSVNIRNFLWKSKDYTIFVKLKAASRLLVLQDGEVEGFQNSSLGICWDLLGIKYTMANSIK
jgi:hypothetical protein